MPLICIAKGEKLESEEKWFVAGKNSNGECSELEIEKLSNPDEPNNQAKCFIPTYFTDRSPKGWTNQQTWNNYLHFHRRNIP